MSQSPWWVTSGAFFNETKERNQDMMLPVDPIAIAVFVIGVFIYFAVKGSGSAKKGTMSNEDFSEWFRKKELERSPENIRYQKWLYEHRPE